MTVQHNIAKFTAIPNNNQVEYQVHLDAMARNIFQLNLMSVMGSNQTLETQQ